MLITWRGLWACYRARVLGTLAILALCAVPLVFQPAPVRASEGPPAELRDVVSALKDINGALRDVAEGLRAVERALKEKR
jgi:hypothetical protein